MLRQMIGRMPFTAILRGLAPEEALAVGDALVEAGMTMLEVPLNSQHPLESIRLLAERYGETCLIGAGTVMTPSQVAEIGAVGGRLIVMPHGDAEVIRAAKQAGMVCMPGIATPTEGFAALKAGADALKLFPAELVGPNVLRAMRAVFPKQTLFLPVGGVTPENLAEFVRAGADGFGLGSGLYAPGRSAADVRRRADAYVNAWNAVAGGAVSGP
ncbi:2-dehydro-3-deoxy-6-phosphogalactonate aldolase [Lichenicoccus sp.]|uniref:2-dehydro-3-deoxy-6-phosphogalactonate aldolase n=1 Tax=Lichenicoccus sp. TaxID=2781899 RepID=UPI003D0D5CBC